MPPKAAKKDPQNNCLDGVTQLMRKKDVLTWPRMGISQRDSLVTLLKKYGLFSRLLQNLRHPACSNSGGKSCTGSLEPYWFGDISTPWALWGDEVEFTWDTLGISDGAELCLRRTGDGIPERIINNIKIN